VLGKMRSLHETDEFVRTRRPHFAVSHVVPGYVFGRNELPGLAPAELAQANSSNNFLVAALLGRAPPYPVHDVYAHVNDLAAVHLRAALLGPREDAAQDLPADFGVAAPADLAAFFDPVEKAYPKAVAAGIFEKASMPPLHTNWESTGTERLLGRKFESFETAVVDVAGQYLEALGVEKA
jgi:hypothetical protein